MIINYSLMNIRNKFQKLYCINIKHHHHIYASVGRHISEVAATSGQSPRALTFDKKRA